MFGMKGMTLAGLSVLLIAAQISEACLCGAKGVDVCTCNEQFIVRPQPVFRIESARPRTVCKTIKGAQEFSPIGDACSCNTLVVKPAVQPAPSCQQCGQQFSVDKPSCGCGETIRAPYDSPSIYTSASSKPRDVIPADPISLSLAYRAAQQASASVPEERLQYGFRVKPKTVSAKRFSSIAEEKLQAVDRAVIELKQFQSEESEEDDFEEVSDEDDVNEGRPGHLGYGEIGYCAAHSHEPRFEVQRQQHTVQSCVDAPRHGGNQEVVFEVDAVQSNNGEEEIIDINITDDGQYAGCGYNRFRRHLPKEVDETSKPVETHRLSPNQISATDEKGEENKSTNETPTVASTEPSTVEQTTGTHSPTVESTENPSVVKVTPPIESFEPLASVETSEPVDASATDVDDLSLEFEYQFSHETEKLIKEVSKANPNYYIDVVLPLLKEAASLELQKAQSEAIVTEKTTESEQTVSTTQSN